MDIEIRKARLIKRNEQQQEEERQPVKVEKRSARRAAEAVVREWIEHRQAQRATNAKACFAALFAEPQTN